MRQWKVPTSILCKNHLLGEHCEAHMFVGSINKGTSIQGYIDKELVDPSEILNRHDELMHEMICRHMNHGKELPYFNKNLIKGSPYVNPLNESKSLNDLLTRCTECQKRYDIYNKYSNQFYFKTFIIDKDEIIFLNDDGKELRRVSIVDNQ